MTQLKMFAAASSIVLLLWLNSASAFAPTSLSYRQPIATTTSCSSTLQLSQLHDRSTSLNSIPPTNSDNGANDDPQQLHLLTFDLDDTIFPIGPVVADANVAQLNTLIKFGYENACNQQIIAASKQIRTELRDAGDAITYSDLRKQSVQREIERLLVGGEQEQTETVVHNSVIEGIFDAWLTERHASADRNLYPHASSALQFIKEQHPNAIIGAITNGRGNPLNMPSIESYFDFCVSGEDEGVFPNRKPDEGIYKAAIVRYNEILGMQQEQVVQNDGVDLNWIHVGDDLANDVGASAACGAKSIWFRMEEEEDAEPPSWSTATKEELQKRAAMDDVARKFVSAEIDSLEDLPRAIIEVLGL